MKEENSFSINVFPNPAGNQLAISSQQLAIGSIEIFDVLGQRVFNHQPAANSQHQAVIDISKLQSGIYFLSMKSENGVVMKKFVKQ